MATQAARRLQAAPLAHMQQLRAPSRSGCMGGYGANGNADGTAHHNADRSGGISHFGQQKRIAVRGFGCHAAV